MANISPGVFTKIIDLSEYVAGVPSTVGFLPIISERGPDNELILTNSQDFYRDFGDPDILYVGKSYGQGPYVADAFLKQSDSLYVVRCLPQDVTDVDDAEYGNMCLALTAYDSTGNITVTNIDSLNTDTEIDTKLGAGDPVIAVIFYGIGRGEYYNNFRIKISPSSNTLDTTTCLLDIYKRQEENNVESGYPQYEIIESFEVSFDNTELDEAGESKFVEDVINRYSVYIRCKADADTCKLANASFEDANNASDEWSEDFANFTLSDGTHSYANPKFNLKYGSSGGLFDDDGTVNISAADSILTKAYLGTLDKKNGTTLREVLNTEDYYFSIILDGGYPSDVKTNGIYVLATTRLDCVAICDNGDTVSVADAITERNDAHTFNTKYLALYEPYSKVYDSYTGRDLWMSPVVHMANIIAFTDNVGEIWDAPAGFNRATIANIKELRFNPVLSERDQLYLKQLNPIVKFSVGYTVWGQLTSQKRSTAMQDLSITRLVLYVKRALEEYCKFFVFEHNDDQTWQAVRSEIVNFLKTIQNRRGLYDFSVTVGADEYEMKAKKIRVDVILNPTRTVEQIHLNFFIK